MGNNDSRYRMSSYSATLTLNFTKQEFHEHCTEHDVEPDMDQLRSWLMEKAVTCDPAESLRIARGVSEKACC